MLNLRYKIEQNGSIVTAKIIDGDYVVEKKVFDSYDYPFYSVMEAERKAKEWAIIRLALLTPC